MTTETEDFAWWKKRDGSRIRVHFMSYAHLTAAIAMLERSLRAYEDEAVELTRDACFADAEDQPVLAYAGEMNASAHARCEKWIAVLRRERDERDKARHATNA